MLDILTADQRPRHCLYNMMLDIYLNCNNHEKDSRYFISRIIDYEIFLFVFISEGVGSIITNVSSL